MSPITPGRGTDATQDDDARRDTAAARRRTSAAATPRATTLSSPAEPVDGRSTRWDNHREARRRELTHAARRTVHRRGPDVSMDDIAADLGTSKSILYRYFTDKVGLQNAVGEAVVAAITANLRAAVENAPTPRAALHGMIDAYLAMIEHSPSVYYFVTRNTAIANAVALPARGDAARSAPLSSFLGSITTVVAQPFAQAVGNDDHLDVEAWAAGAVGFISGTGEWWLARLGEPGTPDREHVATRITAWLWAGPIGLLARERQATLDTPHNTRG